MTSTDMSSLSQALQYANVILPSGVIRSEAYVMASGLLYSHLTLTTISIRLRSPSRLSNVDDSCHLVVSGDSKMLVVLSMISGCAYPTHIGR